MNNKIIVKKLWSLNPTQYKKITFKEASEEYAKYLVYFKLNSYKTFIDWLESETWTKDFIRYLETTQTYAR